MSWAMQVPMAGRGWLELINGNDGWRKRFELNREGLGVALFFYLVVVLLLVFLTGYVRGALPGYADTFFIVLANALPIGLLGLVFLVTRITLGLMTPLIVFLVPTVHALAYLLIVGFLLSIVGSVFGAAILGMLGYMMYRLGRQAIGISIPLSIAFAALCVLALVLLQLGLYMVTAPPPA